MRKWPWSHRKQHHNAEHWDVEPGSIHCWNCGEWCREKELCLCCMKARWKARAKSAETEIERLRKDNDALALTIHELRVSDQKKDDAIRRVREVCDPIVSWLSVSSEYEVGCFNTAQDIARALKGKNT